MEKPAGKLVFSAENEILLPFLAVGIIVLGGFGVISFYNGYTIEKRGLESTARQVFSVMNQDLDFLAEHVPEEEIREKYRENQPEYLRITDRDGQIIACPREPPEE